MNAKNATKSLQNATNLLLGGGLSGGSLSTDSGLLLSGLRGHFDWF